MGYKVGTTATFKKGQVVTVKAGEYLWKTMTAEERAAWYQVPGNAGMGEDGESRLAPVSTYLKSDGTTPFKVVAARVSARRGYGNSQPGCCQVVDASGTLWYAERRHCL